MASKVVLMSKCEFCSRLWDAWDYMWELTLDGIWKFMWTNQTEIDGIMKFNDIKCAFLLDCIHLSVQLIFRCVGGFGRNISMCRFSCEVMIDMFIDVSMLLHVSIVFDPEALIENILNVSEIKCWTLFRWKLFVEPFFYEKKEVLLISFKSTGVSPKSEIR